MFAIILGVVLLSFIIFSNINIIKKIRRGGSHSLYLVLMILNFVFFPFSIYQLVVYSNTTLIVPTENHEVLIKFPSKFMEQENVYYYQLYPGTNFYVYKVDLKNTTINEFLDYVNEKESSLRLKLISSEEKDSVFLFYFNNTNLKIYKKYRFTIVDDTLIVQMIKTDSLRNLENKSVRDFNSISLKTKTEKK